MSKTSMTAIALGAFGAALLASAAPLNATTIGSAEVSNVDQAGLFCNEYYGRCWRTRGPRYVLRYYYDPSYSPGRGYNYYAAPATTIAATATANRGSPFAAGSPLGLPVPPSLLAPAEGGSNEG